MNTETVGLVLLSVGFGLIGYGVGWLRNLWQIRKCFPDLYDELKRRCDEDA